MNPAIVEELGAALARFVDRPDSPALWADVIGTVSTWMEKHGFPGPVPIFSIPKLRSIAVGEISAGEFREIMGFDPYPVELTDLAKGISTRREIECIAVLEATAAGRVETRFVFTTGVA